MGWLVVGLYLLSVCLCVAVALGYRKSHPHKNVVSPFAFWGALAIVLALLGINKQLDLQSWFTQLIKTQALEQGWYEHRRQLQALFILVIAAGGCVGVAGLAVITRRYVASTWLALVGLGLLAGYVIIRAASFHHVDEIISEAVVGPLRVNHVLESIGLVLIVVNAFWLNLKRNLGL